MEPTSPETFRSEPLRHVRVPTPPVVAADLRIAVLWVLAVVPQAFGFWLVAGDVAGIGPGQRRAFLLAAMLTLGMATLAQVTAGYRLSLYEGPASAYFGAVIIVASTGGTLADISGGMIVAGLTVVLLGIVGFDRLLRRVFTPVTGMVFVLVVTVAVVPPTLERAVAISDTASYGTATGWVSAISVVVVGLGLQRARRLRPYALLGALLAGVAVVLMIDGVPSADLSGGLASPSLFPWGAPQFDAGVALPFVIAAGIAAFNTVAAVEVAEEVTAGPRRTGAARRGLGVHGSAQVAGAMFGNVLGTVSRLDSLPISALLGTTRRTPLVLAAALIIALAFVAPFLGLVAALPLGISAALLAFMLGTMILTTARRLWPLGARARWVAAGALVPSVAWTPLQGMLSPTGQLLANPMLWGVGIGLVLERLLATEGT